MSANTNITPWEQEQTYNLKNCARADREGYPANAHARVRITRHVWELHNLLNSVASNLSGIVLTKLLLHTMQRVGTTRVSTEGTQTRALWNALTSPTHQEICMSIMQQHQQQHRVSVFRGTRTHTHKHLSAHVRTHTHTRRRWQARARQIYILYKVNAICNWYSSSSRSSRRSLLPASISLVAFAGNKTVSITQHKCVERAYLNALSVSLCFKRMFYAPCNTQTPPIQYTHFAQNHAPTPIIPPPPHTHTHHPSICLGV